MRIVLKVYNLCAILILFNFVHCENEIIENTLNLLKDANDNIEVKNNDEIILVFGTGSETNSGFIKFITGQYSAASDYKSLKSNKFSIKDNSVGIKTSYPKLYYAKKNGAAFYDCTRFGDISDPKDPVFPIVSSFYMEKITETATKIKIVFLMDYSKIEQQNNDNALLLLQQAKYVLNDVTQYSSNMGLIITTADREDPRVISSWKQSLSGIVNNFDPNLMTIYHALFNEIPSFDQAYLEASISELSSTRDRTIDFINRLQFQNKNMNNLKVQLPTDSKDLLLKIVSLINRLRETMILEISKFIVDHFKVEETNMDDIEDFKDLINKNLNKIERIIDSYYKHLSAEVFVNDISGYMEELNIEVPKELKVVSLKYDKLLSFFNVLDTKGETKTSSIQWVAKLEHAESYLDRLNCLYIFFKDFSDKLSESIVLDNEADLRIKSYFRNLEKKNKKKRYKQERFNRDNFKFFTKIMKTGNNELKYSNSHLYYRVQNRTLNSHQYTTFFGIYNNAFNSLTINCQQDKKITVTGYNVRFSEINLYHHNFNACQNKEIIEIFVRNKITFNGRFGSIFYKNIKYVLIIAPTWEKNQVVSSQGADTEGPVIGIGSNFYNGGTNLWNLEKESGDRLMDVNNLKIIDINGIIKIDDFAKSKINLPDLGEYINEYKRHLLNNLTDPINKRSFGQFLKILSANPDVNKLYSTRSFYNNLNMLEEFYYNKKNQINYIPLYESLTRAIQLFIESAPKIKEDEKEVLKKLYSAALSKVINLTTDQYNSLVLDHEKYLSFAMDNANEFKDARTIYFVGEKNREYHKKINKKIEEGAQYIEKELKPETDKLNRQISTSIRTKLIKEIKDFEKKAEQEKKDLRKMIIGQSIAAILGVIGTGVSFLGPIGTGVGTAMNAAGGMITSLTSAPMPTVREDLKPKIQGLQNFIKTQQKNQEDSLKSQIQVLKGSDDPNLFNIATSALGYLNGVDITKYDKARTFVIEKLDELQKTKPNLPKSVVNIINKAKSFSKISTISSEIFSSFKNDVGKISSMSSLFAQKNEEIKNLVNLRNTVSNSFLPLLENMANDLSKQIDNMKDKTRISVYFKQYKIQQTLNDFQAIIKDLTTGFQVQAEVLDYMNKLIRAIEATITIYDQIQIYEEQKDLATYIADIRVTGMREHLVTGEYREIADNLTLFIQSNIVVDNYLAAANSLKQFVFPFADFYSDNTFLSDQIQKTMNIRELALLVSDKIEELQKKTKEFTSTHNNDRSLDLMNYYNIPNVKTFAKPFYTWKNEKYRPSISSLLKGSEIILETEILNDTRNALKFSAIEFSIKSDNRTVQRTLNNLLNYYVADLVHLGNSYYKCNNKVYVIPSASASLRHSFYKDSDKKFIYESKLHQELSANKFILSPYASWQVKLTDETRRNDFSQLAALDSSEIYLELSGKAQYVPDDVKCDHNLDKYYKLDSVLKTNA